MKNLKMTMGLLSLGLGLWVTTVSGTDLSSVESVWNDGLRAYKAEEYPAAAARFEQWLQEAQSRGVESAQAHFNLGLCYWKMKSPGPAVLQFLKGATLRNFPWRFSSDLKALSDLQRELGVRSGVPDQFSFQAYLFFSRNILIALIAAGLWFLFLAAGLYFMKFRRLPAWSPLPLVVVGGAFLALAEVGYLNHRYQSPLAVLNHTTEGITLYRSPREGSDEKLVDLPAGTIVQLGVKEGDGFTQVAAPLAGWVKTESLLRL